MNKVAVSMICGDNWNETEVENLLQSLEPWVHGIFVAFNGQGEEPFWQQYTDIPIFYKKFKWEDNFGLARNQSLSMIPTDAYDWAMWLDTDDLFVMQEDKTLEEMFESLDEYTKGIFIKYNYAIEPGTGIVVVEQWRERFFKLDVDWKWQWPVHEVCKAKDGALQIARREHCWINHQRKSGEDRGARVRNRQILSKAIREEPDNDRYWFYFAGETMAEADTETDYKTKMELADAAIHAFSKFIEMRDNLDEDVFLATTRIAELYRMKGEFPKALQTDLESIAVFPSWPDGYVGAAKTCMEMYDWRRMKDFSTIAMGIHKPQTAVSIEPLQSSFTPIFLRGLANEELREYDAALKDYKKAIKYWNPPNGSLEQRIKNLKAKKNKDPNENDERKKLRGTKPEKSICFFTNPLVEVWHPEVLKKHGAGGAETCIMELAPKFVEAGWRTVVFGTPGEYRGVYEGVEYWDAKEWVANEPFTVFISSRSPYPFESNINSQLKLLWMHDVNVGEMLTPLVNNPDVIVGLSQWHVQHLQKLYNIDRTRLAIVPNGISLSRFQEDRSNDPDNAPNFIWTSSPDRGLDTVLGLWPMIKEAYPEATLEIYYGWQMIDKIIEQYHLAGARHLFLEGFREKVEHQLEHLGREKSGIFWKGRVSPDELSQALYRSNFLLYPTVFMETFCISALQAQAAGVIPITSKLAALTENVAQKRNLVEGWPSNSNFQYLFLKALDDMISEDPFGEEIRIDARQKGRKLALSMSWDNSFNHWVNLFWECGVVV